MPPNLKTSVYFFLLTLYFNSYFQGWHQMYSEATVSNLAQSAPKSKSVKWLFYCNKTFPGNSQRSCTSSDKVEVVNFLFIFVFPQWSQCLFEVFWMRLQLGFWPQYFCLFFIVPTTYLCQSFWILNILFIVWKYQYDDCNTVNSCIFMTESLW